MKKTYLPPAARMIVVSRGFHLLQNSVNAFARAPRTTLGDAAEDGAVSASRPTPVYTFRSLWDYDE